MSIFDDGEDDGMRLDWEHAVTAVAVAVSVIGTNFRVVLNAALSDSAVTVNGTTTVVVSVLLWDVEPDVRLLMTIAGPM